LLILNEEKENEADRLCDGPCPACYPEEDYFKINLPNRKYIKKCVECEKFAKLFIQLKKWKDTCFQLKRLINYTRNHCKHENFCQRTHQINNVEEGLKTGIPESLRKAFMKVAHKL
jgi:hypothetical protein